ncbi:hypothetical protein [Micromonospora sp. NBC_01796]|uniref:hypothetical protein n=1 Tax=Micromonospora sp. NBC_01796 TaxID=2975987 RepID=UPI002DD8021B|nr:hypothetical protein [Micromonospora sp. NBC_01796]WSA85137.1 hypothetical protein OIE47_33055 [Micromonospora sp. NBC_01796]
MHPWTANEDSRLSLWLHVREFAVPASMIEAATARRTVGDWAGACAAARVDVDLNPRAAARTHGQEIAARLRADLRHLAPDLLRWHMPRIAPDGLLRPGLTISLARYQQTGGDGVHLVARTPPAWADAGQRISLALWDPARSSAGHGPHPHPRPDRRFRLDLHRHLWDARRTGELRVRAGTDGPPADGHPGPDPEVPLARDCAVNRWAAEAGILLRAQGRAVGTVAVRLGARKRLLIELSTDPVALGHSTSRITAASGSTGHDSTLPVLPDAATWVLPDLALLRAGLVEADRLHPLVASALVPGRPQADERRARDGGADPRLIECGGSQHRIGLVDGQLVPLDHDPAEIRREELLAALGGTPMPCLRAIDEAHRHPEDLVDIRARLDHGDIDGALGAVEGLLGPGALLRGGALRDALEMAARGRIAHGLFRAGLAGDGKGPATRTGPRPRDRRAHPRHATSR